MGTEDRGDRGTAISFFIITIPEPNNNKDYQVVSSSRNEDGAGGRYGYEYGYTEYSSKEVLVSVRGSEKICIMFFCDFRSSKHLDQNNACFKIIISHL